MRIKVKVTPRSSRNAIEKLREGEYRVWVTAVPEKGKANRAVIELLALECRVAKSQIRLVSGQTSSSKVFELL